MPQTGLAPTFAGQRQNALVVPVRFGPESYFVGVNVRVCEPSETASFLGQRLSVRLFVDGPPLAAGAFITLWLWPELQGAKVPLQLTEPGMWVIYAGRTPPPPAPGEGRRQPDDVVIDFTYTGEAEWEGKLWIDELRIVPPG